MTRGYNINSFCLCSLYVRAHVLSVRCANSHRLSNTNQVSNVPFLHGNFANFALKHVYCNFCVTRFKMVVPNINQHGIFWQRF